MNSNPKLMNAVRINDLKLSTNLLDFLNEQFPSEYITKADIADVLEMLKDLDASDTELPEDEITITPEVAQLAKLVTQKRIDIIIM